ncbi:unnamed protein product [Paramecium primaurelia]|uniref:Uncharacterized protein n=1 Tax=Paramecium primaurelia TaxID=5886 RepID=A0A8S1KED8_PARPR|nr:unnamed protein product [Paramecium primaurelia]
MLWESIQLLLRHNKDYICLSKSTYNIEVKKQESNKEYVKQHPHLINVFRILKYRFLFTNSYYFKSICTETTQKTI